MQPIGILLVMGGIIAMLYAVFGYDPSVETFDSSSFGLPDRVNNTGLLQRQLMIFLMGATATVTGAIAWVGAIICSSLDHLSQRHRGNE